MLKRWLRIGLTATLVAGIVAYLGGPGALLDAVSGVDPGWLAICLAVVTVDRFFMVYKWLYLLDGRRMGMSLLTGMKIYCTAMIWGLFLPSTVGADGIRTYLSTRAGLNTSDVIASIVVERVIGFIASLSLGVIGFILLEEAGLLDPRLNVVLSAGAVTMGVGIVLFVASLNRTLYRRFNERIPARVRSNRIWKRIGQFHDVYAGFGDSRRKLAAFGTMTFAEQFSSVAITWTVAMALHVDVGLMFVAGAVPLTMLISRLPISVDGIGVFEGVFAALMALAGVPAAEAVAIAILARLVQIVGWAPWWIAYSLQDDAVRRAEVRGSANA